MDCQYKQIIHFSSVFCGYHANQHLWIPSIGEVLVVKQEQNNCHDKHVVDIIKMAALLVMYQTISSRMAFNFLNHDEDVTYCEIL